MIKKFICSILTVLVFSSMANAQDLPQEPQFKVYVPGFGTIEAIKVVPKDESLIILTTDGKTYVYTHGVLIEVIAEKKI